MEADNKPMGKPRTQGASRLNEPDGGRVSYGSLSRISRILATLSPPFAVSVTT
jgi:hypothetical protein